MRLVNDTVLRDPYDVIVVGAGLGGMTAASLLAKRGLSVLMIEQQSKPGGSCTSFKRDGVIFDVGTAMIYGFGEKGFRPFRFLMNELEEPIEVVAHATLARMTFEGQPIIFWPDVDRFLHELGRLFPDEKEGLRAFYPDLYKMYENIVIKNEVIVPPSEFSPRQGLRRLLSGPLHAQDAEAADHQRALAARPLFQGRGGHRLLRQAVLGLLLLHRRGDPGGAGRHHVPGQPYRRGVLPGRRGADAAEQDREGFRAAGRAGALPHAGGRDPHPRRPGLWRAPAERRRDPRGPGHRQRHGLEPLRQAGAARAHHARAAGMGAIPGAHLPQHDALHGGGPGGPAARTRCPGRSSSRTGR